MGEIVEFASNGSTAQGYLAPPPEGGPGVIVIQEWWGLVDHIKDVAERFAREGFVALAPDLYHGEATTEPDEAQKLMMAMDIERAAKDLSGAVDYLKSRDDVRGRIGVVGFCMGGGLALTLASIRPDVAACVPYYAAFMGPQPDLSRVRSAVLGHYAETDGWATPDLAMEMQQELRENGVEATFHIYPDTEHAFFNDTRPEVYDAEAARLSWERTIEFLRRHLA